MKTTVRQLLAGGPTISVGILTADLLRLGDELQVLEQAGAAVVHIDVMDGVFCSQFIVGPLPRYTGYRLGTSPVKQWGGTSASSEALAAARGGLAAAVRAQAKP